MEENNNNNNIELPKMKDDSQDDKIELPKMKEEFQDYQTEIGELKKANKKKNTIYNILYAVIFLLLFLWLGLWIYEYQNVTKGNEPKFCLKKETIKHDDGEVMVCTGIGYKVINYKLEKYKAIEIGPFWIKERINNLES